MATTKTKKTKKKSPSYRGRLGKTLSSVKDLVTEGSKMLAKALAYIPDGKGIELEDDTFLVTGGMDGSDKCYGFINAGGEILIITRNSSGGYPISDMDEDDLNYIFNLSAPNIFKKISDKKYEIVDAELV